MKLKTYQYQMSVCQVVNYDNVDLTKPFTFIATTDEEHSLVCETKYVPENVIKRDDGWMMFRIEGVLEFSLIGILSRISSILAVHQIGLFAVSTYNTDYILVKAANFSKAMNILKEEGYEII